MIILLKGNVKFPLTLDASVWIFDDRKIEFERAFIPPTEEADKEQESEREAEKSAIRFSQDVYQQKLNPPINRSISKFEREKILTGTFVMPLKPFVENAEVNEDAKTAVLVSATGKHEISIEALKNGVAKFAENGKPLKEDGPIHFYFGDGSNKDAPIKGITEIVIK